MGDSAAKKVDGDEAAISFPENGAIEKFLNFASSPSAAKLADVKIVAAKDAKLFRCHRIVIAAQSEFLASLLREVDDCGEVTIIVPDVDASLIEALHRYGTIHLYFACQFYLTLSYFKCIVEKSAPTLRWPHQLPSCSALGRRKTSPRLREF